MRAQQSTSTPTLRGLKYDGDRAATATAPIFCACADSARESSTQFEPT